MRQARSTNLSSVLFIIISVGIASSLSLLGGIGIEVVQAKLLTIVPLLIALPALNSMVGDYATLIAAHAGDPGERSFSKSELLKAMFPSMIVSTVFVSAMSLVMANQRGYHIHSTFLITFLGFIVVAIFSIIGIMFLLTFILEKLLSQKNLNPDDVLIPIVTTITDIFMLGSISLAAWQLF